MGIAYVTITTRSPLWKLPLISSKADWILSVLKIEPFPINSLYLSPDEMLSIPNLRASKDG